MRLLAVIFGIALIALVAQDGFETIILPRRVTRRTQVSLPPWLPPADALDDWQTSAWDEQFPSIHQTLNKVMHPQ